MALQLDDVFTSKGIGRRKIQQQALVDDLTGGCVKIAEVSVTWSRRGLPPAEGLSDTHRRRPGQTDDANASPTGRRRLRGDGISAEHIQERLMPSASILRVITHCWSIDSVLLVIQ